MPGSPASATAREVFERGQRLLQQAELDPDALAGQFAPVGVLELPFAPPGVPRRIEGRAAIRGLYSAAAGRRDRPAFEFGRVVVHETVDPETIITEFEVHARHPQSGEPYQFANLQVITVRGGEIVSLRDYWNPLDRPELAALSGAPA
jgi:uncharacterized protein